MASENGMLKIAGLSHVGNKRERNEDSIGIDSRLGLAVLADGMGGYQGGQIASALAVRIVVAEIRAHYAKAPRRLAAAARDDWHQWVLRSAFEKANGIIHNLAGRKPQWNGMGTTLVAVLFHHDRVTIGHIGDSRLYRLRRNRLQQITADHSLLQELVDAGLCKPEDGRGSLNRNLITRAVGIAPSVQSDIKHECLHSDDLYLLCSDGLTDLVEDREIHQTLSGADCALRRAAVSLIRLANDRGGQDNTSVIIANCKTPFQPELLQYVQPNDLRVSKVTVGFADTAGGMRTDTCVSSS